MMKFLTLSRTCARRLALMCAMLASLPAWAVEQPSVTIIADASLMQPLRSITQAYTRERNIGVTLIADPMHYPVKQLSEGLAADMVLTGNQRAQSKLDEMGMIDQFASRVVMYEPIALVARDASPLLNGFSSQALKAQLLASGGIPFCVLLEGDAFPEMAEVPAIIAASALDPVPTMKYVHSPEELEKALERPNYFSAMPLSMAQRNTHLKIFSVLRDANQRVAIRGEILAGTRMEAARALLAYLTSDAANAIWQQYGFIPAN